MTHSDTHLQSPDPGMTVQRMADELPPLLRPGVGVADHAVGINAAFRHRFPGVPLLGCYAHITWHYTHGATLSKKHYLFDDIKLKIEELHTCHTTGMWNVLLRCLARLWGSRDPALNQLWNSILVAPYDNWHLGAASVAGVKPSQQPQEVRKPSGTHSRDRALLHSCNPAFLQSRILAIPCNPSNPCNPVQGWHQTGVMARLKGNLRAGMEFCLSSGLPKVVLQDGVNAPDYLGAGRGLEHVPTAMLRKAWQLAEAKETCIIKRWEAEHPHPHRNVYYVLSQTLAKENTKITEAMVNRHARRVLF